MKWMISDPSFLYQLIIEQTATIGCSVWSELKNRKERIKQEWDLALINIPTVSACNAFVVWSLVPCRSYKRVHSFFSKAAELCLVGITAGAVQVALLKSLSAKEVGSNRGWVYLNIPSIDTNILGYGAFLGFYANLRYQLLCGINGAMFNHFDVPRVVIFFKTTLRLLKVHTGEKSRLAWLGVEADPLFQSDNLLTAYKRNFGGCC